MSSSKPCRAGIVPARYFERRSGQVSAREEVEGDVEGFRQPQQADEFGDFLPVIPAVQIGLVDARPPADFIAGKPAFVYPFPYPVGHGGGDKIPALGKIFPKTKEIVERAAEKVCRFQGVGK